MIEVKPVYLIADLIQSWDAQHAFWWLSAEETLDLAKYIDTFANVTPKAQ